MYFFCRAVLMFVFCAMWIVEYQAIGVFIYSGCLFCRLRRFLFAFGKSGWKVMHAAAVAVGQACCCRCPSTHAVMEASRRRTFGVSESWLGGLPSDFLSRLIR